jgi:NO-binding membrane sensor protein with MHYT domain
MSVTTLFDILLVLVALLVTWFASFVVLRLFKGQG